ncbi:MAG TPA: hypothetical protein PLW93_03025, partial [Candidatus Absconditabacterales bacterium]|nr:hypothetical protein [Candidatus Absconditabacterales bacterium]
MISTSSQPVRIKSIKGLLIGCIIIQSSIQGLIQLSFAQEVNLSDITTQEGVQGATNTPEENTNQAMEVISEDNLSTESSTMTDTISN